MGGNLKKSVGMFYHMQMSDGSRVGWTNPEPWKQEGRLWGRDAEALKVASGGVLDKAYYFECDLKMGFEDKR